MSGRNRTQGSFGKGAKQGNLPEDLALQSGPTRLAAQRAKTEADRVSEALNTLKQSQGVSDTDFDYDTGDQDEDIFQTTLAGTTAPHESMMLHSRSNSGSEADTTDVFAMSQSSLPPGHNPRPEWVSIQDHTKLQQQHSKLQEDYDQLLEAYEATESETNHIIASMDLLAREKAEMEQLLIEAEDRVNELEGGPQDDHGRNMRPQLEDLERTLSEQETEHQNDIRVFENTIAQLNDELAAAKAAASSDASDADTQHWKNMADEQQKQNAVLEQSVDKLQKERASFADHIATLEDQIEDLEKANAALEQQTRSAPPHADDDLAAKFETLERDNDQLRFEISELQAEKASLSEKLGSRRESLAHGAHVDKQKLLDDIADLRGDVMRAESANKQLLARNKVLDEQVAELRQELDEARDGYREVDARTRAAPPSRDTHMRSPSPVSDRPAFKPPGQASALASASGKRTSSSPSPNTGSGQDSRPMTPLAHGSAELQEMQQHVQRLEEELAWLHACHNAVRDQNRDAHTKTPPRPGNGPPFLHTQERALSRKSLANQEKVQAYLQHYDCPPESSTWQQVNTLFKRCTALEEHNEQRDQELDRIRPQHEQTLAVLKLSRKESIVPAVSALKTHAAELEQDLELARKELRQERRAHTDDVKRLESEQRDMQRAHMLSTRELETAMTQAQAKHQREQEKMLEENNHLQDELEAVKENVTVLKTQLDDAIKSLDTGRQQEIKAKVEASSRQAAARSPAAASSSRRRPRKQPSLDTSQRSLQSSMTSPRRLDSEAVSALSESSSQVHELMLRHRDEVAGLRTRIKEQAAEHEDVVKRLRTEQEKQHDQHREQLREMNAQHQKKTLQLQTALDEAVLARDRLEEELVVAESSRKSIQNAADESHQRLIDMETHLEEELQVLQEAMLRDQESAALALESVEREKAAAADNYAQQLTQVSDQLQYCDTEIATMRKEIERLQSTLKEAQQSHADELNTLQSEHDKEMDELRDQHDAALRKERAALREVYETSRVQARDKAAASSSSDTLPQQLRDAEKQLDRARHEHEVEKQEMNAKFEAQLSELEENITSINEKHDQQLEEMEDQHDALMHELEGARQSLSALQLALAAKEDELSSARETFDDERITFSSALERLEAQVSELEHELQTVRSLRTEEREELMQDKAQLLQELQQASEAARVLKATLDAKTAELAHVREAAVSQRDTLNETLAGDLERERTQRRSAEVAQSDKIRRLTEEREKLLRNVTSLENRLTAAQAEKTKTLDELTTERTSMKVKLDNHISALEQQQRETEQRLRQTTTELDVLKTSIKRSLADCVEHPDPAMGAEESLRHMSREFARTRAQVDVLGHQLEQSEASNSELASEVKTLQDRLASKSEEATAHASGVREHRTEVTRLAAQVQNLEKRVHDLLEENGHLKEKVHLVQEDAAAQAAQGSADNAHLNSVLDSVRSGFDIEKRNFQSQVESLRQELSNTQEQVAALRQQRRELETQLDTCKSELTTTASERDGLDKLLAAERERRQEADRRNADVADQNARLQADLSEANSLVGHLRSEVEMVESHVQIAEGKLQDQADKLHVQGEQLKALEADKAQLEGALTDFEKIKAAERNSSNEVNVLNNDLDNLRQARDKLQQELMQVKAAQRREKANHSTVVGDLERQIEVLKVRAHKQHDADVEAQSSLKALQEERNKLDRELEKTRTQNSTLQATQSQLESMLREKERQIATLKKRTDNLTTENSRLSTQRRAVEDRTRREHSRMLGDVQKHLQTKDDAIKSLERLKDASSSSAGRRTYDRRLAQLGTQVRRLGADLRQERFERETSVIHNSTSRRSPTRTLPRMNETAFAAALEIDESVSAARHTPTGDADTSASGLPPAIEPEEDDEQ